MALRDQGIGQGANEHVVIVLHDNSQSLTLGLDRVYPHHNPRTTHTPTIARARATVVTISNRFMDDLRMDGHSLSVSQITLCNDEALWRHRGRTCLPFLLHRPEFFRYRPFLFFIGQERPSILANLLARSPVGDIEIV
jgi:hypothetical protein